MNVYPSRLATAMREGEIAALVQAKKSGRQVRTVASRQVWEAYHKFYGAEKIMHETRIVESDDQFCVSYLL